MQWAALVVLFLAIVSLTTGSGAGQKAESVPGLHSNPLTAPSNSCLLYEQLVETMRNSRWSPAARLVATVCQSSITRDAGNLHLIP